MQLRLGEYFDVQKNRPKGGFTFTEEGINPVAWEEFCSLCQAI
jgi:hypothetical protein